jgi:hypothetical protein
MLAIRWARVDRGMRLLLVLALASCTSMNLRAGAVMFGDRPAFQATVDIGPTMGRKHPVQLTHEHGVSVSGDKARYVGAVNLDVYQTSEELAVARIGLRVRSTSEAGIAIGARGAFYFGVLQDRKDGSAGLGVELGGAIDPFTGEPVLEASMVMSGRVKM